MILVPNQLPAYITWVQYERNMARLRANQARADEIRSEQVLQRSWASGCAHASTAMPKPKPQ